MNANVGIIFDILIPIRSHWPLCSSCSSSDLKPFSSLQDDPLDCLGHEVGCTVGEIGNLSAFRASWGFFRVLRGCSEMRPPLEVLDEWGTPEAAFNFAALTLAGRNDMRKGWKTISSLKVIASCLFGMPFGKDLE